MPLMAANLALWHGRRAEVVLVGTPGSADLMALEHALFDRYLSWAVTIARDPEAPSSPRAPWLASMGMRDGQARAYVCHQFTCQAPTSDPATLGRELDDASAPRRITL